MKLAKKIGGDTVHKKMLLMFIISCFTMSFSLSNAEDYVINDYTFTWHVIQVGKVKLKIQKEEDRLTVVIGSFGGKLATLYLQPSHAKAIGEVLLKSEEYYQKHLKSEERDQKDSVQVGKYLVVFSSLTKGKDFEVRVRESKTFTFTSVLFSKDEAIKMAGHLMDAEKMAALVEKRIRP